MCLSFILTFKQRWRDEAGSERKKNSSMLDDTAVCPVCSCKRSINHEASVSHIFTVFLYFCSSVWMKGDKSPAVFVFSNSLKHKSIKCEQLKFKVLFWYRYIRRDYTTPASSCTKFISTNTTTSSRDVKCQ